MNEMILWSPGVTLEEIERQVIVKAFAHFRQNKTQTAHALGVSVRTLDNKFEKYEADRIAHEKKERDFRHEKERQLRQMRGNPPAQYDTSAGAMPLLGMEPFSPGPAVSAPQTAPAAAAAAAAAAAVAVAVAVAPAPPQAVQEPPQRHIPSLQPPPRTAAQPAAKRYR